MGFLNVLLFGEKGVGKSSVVNLIAGRRVASLSSTESCQEYNAKIGGGDVYLWDTVGLDASSSSSKAYAVKEASKAIQETSHTGGLHLLLFCIQAGRATSFERRSYNLFYETLCEGRVPVVLVITHCEDEDPMEGWWSRNGSALMTKCGIDPVAHVCVTALAGHSKYDRSRKAIRDVLAKFVPARSITAENEIADKEREEQDSAKKEREREEREKAESAKREKEERERAERERREIQDAERKRAQRERAEREREKAQWQEEAKRERAGRERVEREKAEWERAEWQREARKEKAGKEKLEREREEREEAAKRERVAKERAVWDRAERERIEWERARNLQDLDPDTRQTLTTLIRQCVASSPHLLIDTHTGYLLDRTAREDAFDGSLITDHLASSSHIEQEVKKFYRYATLSHTWEGEEPSFQLVQYESINDLQWPPSIRKLQDFCALARAKGIRWAWMDSCCINQRDQMVLQESMVAMFGWYHGSSLTIIFLRGVGSQSSQGCLSRSRWNQRAWTFQEFVAARVVQFYTEEWTPYLNLTIDNHKESPEIISEMQQAVTVSDARLLALQPGTNSVREKLYLASTRQATRAEDVAYSLFGIFGIALPVIYGEGGEQAIGRLLENVLGRSGDVTILAWTGTSGRYNSCLPASLEVYNKLQAPHIPSTSQNVELAGSQHYRRLGPGLRPSLLWRRFIGRRNNAMEIYKKLRNVLHPTFATGRLTISALSFPLNNIVRQTSGIYHGSATALGDVKIETSDDLSRMSDLVLIHPWIHLFLVEEFELARDDKSRALRVLARLGERFGALLLMRRGFQEYVRVASDSLIMVQIRQNALPDLGGKIETFAIM